MPDCFYFLIFSDDSIWISIQRFEMFQVMGSIVPTEPGQTDIYDLSVGPVDPKEMTYVFHFQIFEAGSEEEIFD